MLISKHFRQSLELYSRHDIPALPTTHMAIAFPDPSGSKVALREATRGGQAGKGRNWTPRGVCSFEQRKHWYQEVTNGEATCWGHPLDPRAPGKMLLEPRLGPTEAQGM